MNPKTKTTEELLKHYEKRKAFTVLIRRLLNRNACYEQSSSGLWAEKLLKLFISCPGSLPQKLQSISELIDSLDENVQIKEQLQALGYSPAIWSSELKQSFQGALPLRDKNEVYLENVQAHLQELVDVLEMLDVYELKVAGKRRKVHQLFKANLDLQTLEQQQEEVRSHIEALKHHPAYLQASQAYLRISKKCQQLKLRLDRQTQGLEHIGAFSIAMMNSFLDSVASCDSQIAGCYAPNGLHAEVPIENGIRANRKIVVLKDFAGYELENVEVFMSKQGLFVWDLYSSGHLYDTDPLWFGFFESLVRQDFVPRVILSPYAPGYLSASEKYQPLKRSGGALQWQDIIFEKSYRDSLPRNIKKGDLIIE